MQLLESFCQLNVFVDERLETFTQIMEKGLKRSVINSNPTLDDLISQSISGLTSLFNLGMLPTEVGDICGPLAHNHSCVADCCLCQFYSFALDCRINKGQSLNFVFSQILLIY